MLLTKRSRKPIPHRHMSRRGYDDMIVKPERQRLARGKHVVRERNIFVARIQIPVRMIMHDDESVGVTQIRSLKDVSDVDF